jgi:hypothetical protein
LALWSAHITASPNTVVARLLALYLFDTGTLLTDADRYVEDDEDEEEVDDEEDEDFDEEAEGEEGDEEDEENAVQGKLKHPRY